MLTVKQLLASTGFDVPPDRIKLVKHVDHPRRLIEQIAEAGELEFYQAEQLAATKPFHDCDAIVSFLARPQNLAEFYGVFLVEGYRPFTAEDSLRGPEFIREEHADGRARIWYELREMETFRPLRGRLVAQWQSTRGWFQRRDLPVYELLPPISATTFPGMERVLVSFEQLKAIFAHPRVHRDWMAALSANAGIYRIVDQNTGEIYIGSAYGEEGLWGRWRTYAQTGHGNNKLLLGRDPHCFRWSIVRTLSRSMSPREVILLEGVEKEKHGSRARGLNGN